MWTTPRHLDRRTAYQIKVLGRIDASWSDWFSGLAITCDSGGDGCPITTLTGAMPDQSALRGILTRIWDLNLTLISVTQIETHSTGED